MFTDPIRISVVGTGKMGFFHTRLLHRLGFLDSIVEPDSGKASKIRKQFKIPTYSTIEELSKKQEPNGVIVAVPTSIHTATSLEVISSLPSLKTLLIEKPVASSVKEACLFQEKVKGKDLKIIVGHVEVYNPVIGRIMDFLKKDVLGKPRSILFQRRGAVAEARLASIGDVYEDIGVHDFDVAMRLFPKGKIQLYSSSLSLDNVGNSGIIVMTSKEQDFLVTFLHSREYAGKLRTIDIEGSKATLCANLLTQMLELRSLEIARGEKNSSSIRIPFFNGEQIKVYGEPLLTEMWNLVDCIRGVAEPLVTVEDGIKALRLVEGARKSIETGKVIELQT